MITLTKFAEIIETGLNNNEQGLNFKVFTDAGKYKEALKTHTEKKKYTNGILRIGTSSIVPVKGITIATQGATLEFCVPLPTPETDEQIITAHRAVFDTYFSAFSVQSITENGKTYTVSSTYSLANTGTTEFRDRVGTSITFYVNISFTYIEDGVNSNAISYKLDGYEIPYTSVHLSKTPTTNSNSSSNSLGHGTSRNSAFIRGWDFEIPATNSALTAIVLDYIENDKINNLHTLTVSNNLGGNIAAFGGTYNVIFGAASMNLEGIQNAGLSFSLLEKALYAEEIGNG